jgi:hypothetical protein
MPNWHGVLGLKNLTKRFNQLLVFQISTDRLIRYYLYAFVVS